MAKSLLLGDVGADAGEFFVVGFRHEPCVVSVGACSVRLAERKVERVRGDQCVPPKAKVQVHA